jgi:lincosamide nucleotidyltransferase A/C/D/E
MAMTASDVVEVVDLLESRAIDVWLDGGWGVDALLEAVTRPHDDLDIVVRIEDVDPLNDALAKRGFHLVKRWPGSPDTYVLGDENDRRVDVHPVFFQENGDAIQRLNDRDWTYPAAGFDGRGAVAGRDVRCLSAEVQILCHAGYELDPDDLRDLQALHDRFGVELLPAQRRAIDRVSSP